MDLSSHASGRSNHRLITDRRENYPNGFVEDCAIIRGASSSRGVATPDIATPDVSTPNVAIPDVVAPDGATLDGPSSPSDFIPGSLILTLYKNVLLTAETGYRLQFQTGMLEGSGISINPSGSIITFHLDGSYRFEICGEATPFSDVPVKLIYHNETFTDDIKIFSQTDIPAENGKLHMRGLATILPIQKDQTVEIKLVPTPDETILVLAQTRLLVYRVA